MMNQYNIRYLSKILCLKAEILYRPFAVIDKKIILNQYDIQVKFDDIHSFVKIKHKIDNSLTVFQVFSESTITYFPVNNDYGEPIIITSNVQPEHNKIPVQALYIDTVESDMFPVFSRLDEDTTKIINSLLQDKENSIKLPKMLNTELSAKILYHKEYPLKYIRYYKNNMMTGVEIMDRVVVNVS